MVDGDQVVGVDVDVRENVGHVEVLVEGATTIVAGGSCG